jgi:hypothetical protein
MNIVDIVSSNTFPGWRKIISYDCLMLEFLLFSERFRDNAGKLGIAFSLMSPDIIDKLFPKLPVKVNLLSNGPCPKLLDFR